MSCWHICSSVASFLHVFIGPAWSLFQHRFPTGSVPQAWGPPATAGGFLLQSGSQGLQGGILPYHGLHQRLQEKPLHWYLDHILLLLPHGPCYLQNCFSHIFSLIFSLTLTPLAVVGQVVLPFPKSIIPPLLMGSALASSRSIFGNGWGWIYQTTGETSSSFHRSQPCSPSTT